MSAPTPAEPEGASAPDVGETLQAAFRRLEPQGSPAWNFDEAMRTMAERFGPGRTPSPPPPPPPPRRLGFRNGAIG